MSITTQSIEKNYDIAQEIFRQITASKVNGFPFLAYTGAKAGIYSETAILMKMPSNPNKVSTVIITYDKGSDTYIVEINGRKGTISTHSDVYADVMADLISRKMGIQ